MYTHPVFGMGSHPDFGTGSGDNYTSHHTRRLPPNVPHNNSFPCFRKWLCGGRGLTSSTGAPCCTTRPKGCIRPCLTSSKVVVSRVTSRGRTTHPHKKSLWCLENLKTNFKKSHFDRALSMQPMESMVMDKLVAFQVNHSFHKTGGLLKWKIGNDKERTQQFAPHELVQPCGRMPPRPPNPCLSHSVTLSRFWDGCKVGYLPMSMHACYTSTRLTLLPHPGNGMGSGSTGKPNILPYPAGEPDNVEYLKTLRKKPTLTCRFGTRTSIHKL